MNQPITLQITFTARFHNLIHSFSKMIFDTMQFDQERVKDPDVVVI